MSVVKGNGQNAIIKSQFICVKAKSGIHKGMPVSSTLQAAGVCVSWSALSSVHQTVTVSQHSAGWTGCLTH